MKKNSVLFFALLLTALMLAGCPGDEPGESLTAPDTPQGVTVTPDDQRLAVTWQPAARADTYEVKWGTGASQSHDGITGTGYTITSLTNDQAYPIEVRAKNASGESGWSDAVSGTPKEPASAPGNPTAAPTIAQNGDTLTVTWTAVTGATTYQVFFGTAANPTTQYGSAVSGTSVDITLPGNGTYYVRIKAGNSKGYSDYGPGASIAVSNVPTVIGSWKSSSSSSTTYTFGENGKLIESYNDNEYLNYSNYYYYDSALREFYWALDLVYTLSGSSLNVPTSGYFLSGEWTASGNNGLTGTWTNTNNSTTMEIAANTITIGPNVYPYYTVSEESSTRLVYKASSEPAGRYTLSGNKLQFTQIGQSTYEREGTGSGIIGTWKDEWTNGYAIWTFNANNTAKKEYSYSEDVTYEENYTLYTVSGSKITVEQEFGTLSGNTLTANGMPMQRIGSGSGVIGTWSGSYNDSGYTVTVTATVTSTEMQYTATYQGGSDSGTSPIRIDGNTIYVKTEVGYAIEGSTLTLIDEYTNELSRVN
jgi:hypothetical protein